MPSPPNWRGFTAELYVSNLFNARCIPTKFNGCDVSECDGDRYVIYNQPRLVGLRFGQRF